MFLTGAILGSLTHLALTVSIKPPVAGRATDGGVYCIGQARLMARIPISGRSLGSIPLFLWSYLTSPSARIMAVFQLGLAAEWPKFSPLALVVSHSKKPRGKPMGSTFSKYLWSRP